MHIEMYKAFRQFVTEQGVVFYYNGNLSQPIISAMGEALRSKLEAEDSSSRITRKVFSTFIEMMQNIVHYAHGNPEDPQEPAPFGNVAVGRRDDHYYIVSGNAVASGHVDRLKSKLETIRTMSVEEIKAEYKRKLHADTEIADEGSKGAGLGLLTVAREASSPIEYLFEPYPGTVASLSYFYLKAVI